MAKKVFLTFAGGSENYRQSVYRLSHEVGKTQVFDEVHGYTDQSLSTDPRFQTFIRDHGDFIRKHPRGFGYWLWKPYLVRELFAEMKDGDLLIYADAGCEVATKPHALQDLVETLLQQGAAFFQADHDHYSYTKMDLLQKLTPLHAFFEQPMLGATVFGLVKNESSHLLVNEWWTLATAENYHYLDDSPSQEPNHSSFIDHRHDQSIFSLLLYAHGFDRCYTPLVQAAFDLVRNRSGKNRVCPEILARLSYVNQIPAALVREARTSSTSVFTRSDRDVYDFLFADLQQYLFSPTAPLFMFHTECEVAPFWECQFVKPLFLERLILWNRPGYEDRAIPLHITGFDQQGQAKNLAVIHYAFGGAEDNSPLVVELSPRLGAFNGIRLQVDGAKGPTWLHLARMMICISPWNPY